MIDIKKYVATLGVRPAEMSGLRELPSETKNALTPIVLLAPWLATVPLSRALDKFEDSYPKRRYFVDIDTSYVEKEEPNLAAQQWRRLASNPPNIQDWTELLKDYPYADPCLLMRGLSFNEAKFQISWAREHGRRFCIRLTPVHGAMSSIPNWVTALINDPKTREKSDHAVVLDFGWVSQNFQLAEPNVTYISSFISNIPEDIPVVVSYTSFPKDFSKYEGIGQFGFSGRGLVKEIRKLAKREVIYGDWASTRPRSLEFAGRPRTRIDYPLRDSWIFSRNEDRNMTYQDAAIRLMKDPNWKGNMGIWGEKLIEGAAQGAQFAMGSIQKMSAARINMHLHQQAFYHDGLPKAEDLDEELGDELDED